MGDGSGWLDGDLTFNNGNFDYWVVKLTEPCTTISFYVDSDGDGFGDVSIDSIACDLPIGYVLDSTDCDDSNELIFPTATDICNSIDDNCNGLIDEDAIFVQYFLDSDADGYGDLSIDSMSCTIVSGYVENDLDCNDLNAEIKPDAIEMCNAIDDNCNFDIDEGLTVYTFYIDADGDGFGNSVISCRTLCVS